MSICVWWQHSATAVLDADRRLDQFRLATPAALGLLQHGAHLTHLLDAAAHRDGIQLQVALALDESGKHVGGVAHGTVLVDWLDQRLALGG